MSKNKIYQLLFNFCGIFICILSKKILICFVIYDNKGMQ